MENPVEQEAKQSAPRVRMAFKDWASLTFSCLALLISGGSAYFNVVLQKDDIRVVIGSTPFFSLRPNGDIATVGEQELTFINSGNRAAAITSITALVTRFSVPEDLLMTCDGPDVYRMRFEVEAFVIKPGEILVKKIPVSRDLGWNEEKGGVLVLPKKMYEAKHGDKYLACLAMNITTPDSFSKEVSPRAFEYVLKRLPLFSEEEKRPLFEHDKPVVMLQRSGSIFSHPASE
jgi:hypothetical protein